MSPTETEIQPITIIAVPFPGQSHVNQLLHFSLILTSRNLPVHFAGPPDPLRRARLRLHGWPTSSVLRLCFHELPLPPAPPHLPSALHLFESPLLLRPLLRPLLHSLSLSSRRLVLLHDPFMSAVALDAADLPNAESYPFHCVAAFQTLFELRPNRPLAHPIVAAQFDGWVPETILDRVRRLEHDRPVEAGSVANSCRALDGEFVDLLEVESGKKVFAVSPLHLVGPRMLAEEAGRRHECLKWLDRQPPASVVYVSFGSTTTMPAEQVRHIAIGLRRSGQRFLWVMREADEGAIVPEFDGGTGGLPAGFEEEIKGFSMVMREWAPQTEILSHLSTAAFISHCGWNSTMESLSAGVPIIAWPMQIDQPRNAMAIAKYWKAGVVVREWDRRNEVVPAARVEELVKMVVVDDEGKEVRERAKRLGEEIRKAVAEGGSSMADLNAFVTHITRSG